MEKKLYFVGAGGIGMANLVRYYLAHGAAVAGYDRAPSELTATLEQEGLQFTDLDDRNAIPEPFRNPDDTLVVYTPAIPEDNDILRYFRDNGFRVIKRAALLGRITEHTDGICVAGSHGKTTTSSMLANILRGTEAGCTAFLGGILRNTGSNLVLNEKSRYSVIEADEYDRSFHQLHPWLAVVTSTDPDHLDIYGDEEHYLEAFSIFTSLIRPGGRLLVHTGLKFKPAPGPDVTVATYSGGSEGDWHAEDITYGDGTITFTLVGPDGLRIERLSPGVPVDINIDNAVAAAAAAITGGSHTRTGARGTRFVPWRETPLRDMARRQGRRHGADRRLRPLAQRDTRQHPLGAQAVHGQGPDRDIPAAPLHTHPRFRARLRRRTVGMRPPGDARDISGARASHTRNLVAHHP